jgi:hypothetical protein
LFAGLAKAAMQQCSNAAIQQLLGSDTPAANLCGTLFVLSAVSQQNNTTKPVLCQIMLI